MTFVVSNLYGRLDKFEQLIKKINLKDSDILYVLGNIVDYGEKSIELVNDLSTRYNVYSVLGEHDYKAYLLLSEFYRILKPNGKVIILIPSLPYLKKTFELPQINSSKLRQRYYKQHDHRRYYGDDDFYRLLELV